MCGLGAPPLLAVVREVGRAGSDASRGSPPTTEIFPGPGASGPTEPEIPERFPATGDDLIRAALRDAI